MLTRSRILAVFVTGVKFQGVFLFELTVIIFMYYSMRSVDVTLLENFPFHISTGATKLISDCGHRFVLWLQFSNQRYVENFPCSARYFLCELT